MITTLMSLPVLISLASALILWPVNTRRLTGREAMEQRPRDGPLWWSSLRLGSNSNTDPLSRASELRLLAACLNAGLSPVTAVEAVASTAESPAWSRLATLLSVGVPPATAWGELACEPGFEEVAVVARNASRSGAAMSSGCIRIAQQLEEQAQDVAVARAEKASVMIAVPLSLCFLPAFIVLGLVPLIFNLGLNVL